MPDQILVIFNQAFSTGLKIASGTTTGLEITSALIGDLTITSSLTEGY